MTGATTAAGVVHPVTEATYQKMVLSARGPVLVAFMAEADSTCKALLPVLSGLAAERAGRLSVTTIDAAADAALARAWGVTQVPIMLLFHRGLLERVLRGVRPLARLIQEIDESPAGRDIRYPALLRRVHDVPKS